MMASRDGSVEILQGVTEALTHRSRYCSSRRTWARVLHFGGDSASYRSLRRLCRMLTWNTTPANIPYCSILWFKVRPMSYMVRDFWVMRIAVVLLALVGNWLLTLFSNILTNVNLTDMELVSEMFPQRINSGNSDRGGPFRLRARNHCQDRQAATQDLRGRYQLLGTYLRGRQENRLEGWHACAVVFA